MDYLDKLKTKLMKDPEFKREYDRLKPQYDAMSLIIEARIRKGYTQKKLAAKMGTKQSAIARFESGNTNPTIGFLDKLSRALGKKLVVKFE